MNKIDILCHFEFIIFSEKFVKQHFLWSFLNQIWHNFLGALSNDTKIFPLLTRSTPWSLFLLYFWPWVWPWKQYPPVWMILTSFDREPSILQVCQISCRKIHKKCWLSNFQKIKNFKMAKISDFFHSKPP